ncbi:MAG: hypothetical protein AB1441_10040 [Bacillota bacterium]
MRLIVPGTNLSPAFAFLYLLGHAEKQGYLRPMPESGNILL